MLGVQLLSQDRLLEGLRKHGQMLLRWRADSGERGPAVLFHRCCRLMDPERWPSLDPTRPTSCSTAWSLDRRSISWVARNCPILNVRSDVSASGPMWASSSASAYASSSAI